MSDRGGEPEQLAPVIPLFGAARSQSGPSRRGGSGAVEPNAGTADSFADTDSGSDAVTQTHTDESEVWRSTWSGPDRRAGVIPVTPGAPRVLSERHPARGGSERSAPRLRALQPQEGGQPEGAASDPERLREAAEELLVRKLRTRSLSLSESRLVLRGFEHEGERLDVHVIEDIIDGFCRRGYLDDSLLAGQLVTAGVERKGQGRIALSRALAQRGIPRDVIDAALDELPDDDAERALEYARTKARSLTRFDGDTALRRLVGQLARRGYNGAVAMTAAKAALAEATFGRPATGVRFVDSE